MTTTETATETTEPKNVWTQPEQWLHTVRYESADHTYTRINYLGMQESGNIPASMAVTHLHDSIRMSVSCGDHPGAFRVSTIADGRVVVEFANGFNSISMFTTGTLEELRQALDMYEAAQARKAAEAADQ